MNSSRFLTRLFLLLLILTGRHAAGELQAGAAKVSITPEPREMPYTLGGYVTPERLKQSATGIHDTCYARALALSDGGSRCALVSVDLCFVPASLHKAVGEKLTESGIPAAGLFLAATHTHSAMDPLMLHAGNRDTGSALPAYDEKLTAWISERIAQSVRDAVSRLQPARIGSAQAGPIGLNRNRRGETGTDDEMTALKVVDSKGATLAIVANYAAHPVYYGAGMLQVSGDWSGSFARMMEAANPGAVALFINGAEGDASPHGSDEGTPAEKIEIYATKLAVKARNLVDSIRPLAEGRISAWSQVVEMPPPQPHPFFLLASAQLRATPDQAKALVDRMMPRQVEVSFLRAGDLLFIGIPGEPTTPVGLEVKRAAREKGVPHPAVAALTNGWIGYVVTPEQYRAGKYEPTMSFYGADVRAPLLRGVREGLGKWRQE